MEEFYITVDGFCYVSPQIIYKEDGTQNVTEYDEFGEVIE